MIKDVGFGDSARRPISLPDGQAEDISGRYRIQRASSDGQSFLLQRHQDGCWRSQYRLTTRPRRLAEFQERCNYFQTDPGSHFRRGIICSLATDDGRICLIDKQLVITTGSSQKRTSLDSGEEVDQVLRVHFGLRPA